MRKKGFPINRIPPHILEMCRLRFRTRLDDNRSGPIDYLNLFSISDDDISILLEIAGWLGRDDDMHGCLDAPLHAWEALSLLDPEKVIPGALEVLNHLDWDNLDGFHDEIYIPLAETVAKAPDTIPLFLNALQESQRHEETRAVILDTVRHATWKMSHDKRRFQEVLINQLAERRIDSRNWYASIVCELAFAEDMTPELIELLREVCLGGLVNLSVVACNDGLKEQVGLDFEDDPELRPMYEKFRTVSDILWDFKRCERTFPKDAVNRAREHREQIIPNLIEAVRNATAYARFGVPNRDGTVQFAVHLLAEFQATKALPAIEDSLSLSIDQIWDHLYADGFFEAMPGILHRLMGDDPEIYDQKLRDPSAPVALQCCLSRSIGYLVAEGIVSEETYCDWLRDYLEIAIREKKSELVTDLVCDILFAANPEDIPLVRSAFENELVDEDRMPREEAEEWFQERSTSIAEILPDPKRDFADAAKELSGWSWFQDVSKRLSELKTASPVTIDVSESPSDGILHLPPSGRYPIPLPMSNDDEPEPLKALQKIGRNDPCPCGSGKKYKKCCMK